MGKSTALQSLRSRQAIMLTLAVVSLLAFNLLSSPLSADAHEILSGDAVADSLLALDRHWGQAYVTGDSAFVALLLAEDWMGWFDDHPNDKAAALSELRTGAPRLSQDVIDQATVRVFGTVGVVQARERAQVVDSSGAHWQTHHITDVFIHRESRWLVIASHDSPIPNP